MIAERDVSTNGFNASSYSSIKFVFAFAGQASEQQKSIRFSSQGVYRRELEAAQVLTCIETGFENR